MIPIENGLQYLPFLKQLNNWPLVQAPKFYSLGNEWAIGSLQLNFETRLQENIESLQ